MNMPVSASPRATTHQRNHGPRGQHLGAAAHLAAFAAFAALALMAIVTLITVAGCGPEAVATDDMCVGAVCTGGCDSQKDCPANKKCDVAGKMCVDCLADDDCPAATLCRLSNHACVPACSE